jgi:hypothetical protein
MKKKSLYIKEIHTLTIKPSLPTPSLYDAKMPKAKHVAKLVNSSFTCNAK